MRNVIKSPLTKDGGHIVLGPKGMGTYCFGTDLVGVGVKLLVRSVK